MTDWRLRECDYGQRNGTAAADPLANRDAHLDEPYPGGESWRQAVHRSAGSSATFRCGGPVRRLAGVPPPGVPIGRSSRTRRVMRRIRTGRGLRIVDALADRWGAGGDELGRVVWFEVTGKPGD